MMDNNMFEEKVHAKENRDVGEVKDFNPRSSRENFTLVSDYHLTCDNVRIKIIPSQWYIYVVLGCYDLNMAEGLQK